MSAHITVEVVHAQPNHAIQRYYRVVPLSTVEDVLRLAAADPAFDGIDIAHAAVGVFGQVAHPGDVLRDRDRIEIYRPLAADPKMARRARVRQARRQMKG